MSDHASRRGRIALVLRPFLQTRKDTLLLASLILLAGCVSPHGTDRDVAVPTGYTKVAAPPADSSSTGSAAGSTNPAAPQGPATNGNGADASGASMRQDPGTAPQGPVWGEGSGRSYLVPAVDILAFQFLLNQYDRRYAADKEDYETDDGTIRNNLHSSWVIDTDPFATNQLLHPYTGALYHGFARSAGLTYWESLAYDFVGSAIWEVAGETLPPSLNDQISTTFGGSFLGEAMFRMSNALLGIGGTEPGFFSRLGAFLISPSTGVNRFAYGDRFDGIYPSNGPPTFVRLGLGVRHNSLNTDLGGLSRIQDNEIVADAVIDYGIPGKANYEYERPFDFFHFEMTAASAGSALPESVMVHGLLTGSRYGTGPACRGVFGLYGSYDYIAPEVFSVSSTALSLGTTAQLKFTDAVALQGSCLGGVGWAAAGTISDASTDNSYHYGVCPQGLVALRFIAGSVAMLDFTTRAYYLNGVGSGNQGGTETILRARAALVVRVYDRHALTVQYVSSTREANYDATALTDTFQSIGSVSVMWTFLGDTQFGIVD